eukprot:evm.model.scf_31.9 EVM.evm.TU.scf_31.9   scf_31:180059-191953(+)
MADSLLDFSKPFDVPLLDATVLAFHGATNAEQRSAAEAVLKKLQEHPDSWSKVDAILEHSQNDQTKFFALQILESLVKYRWGAVPEEQREGIKNFVSAVIIKLCKDDATYRSQKMIMSKLNLILVQILKHDWPHQWRSFLPELVGASRTSETLCENSMHVLRMLSEEVFDFSRGELTQAKTKELKASLNSEFRLIHELCHFVLERSQKTELVKATLSGLHAYLSWVPLGYVFEGNLVQILLLLFPQAPYRSVALQCLTEIGSLNIKDLGSHFETLYKVFLRQLQPILPQHTNIADAYEKGSNEDQQFVQNLALFFTGFFRSHLPLLETSQENREALLTGLRYLLNISYVEDIEVFKSCLEFWNFFVCEVYSSSVAHQVGQVGFMYGHSESKDRVEMYEEVLSQLRALMLVRMAKPEEVIVFSDEDGNAVREQLKDSDVLARYKTMRETLVYLSNLDHTDTESQMLEKLRQQVLQVFKMKDVQEHKPAELQWSSLCTLCWAIGSISGTMQEDQESRFLVSVIRDLLNLTEITRGKDNKAIIASNIMYVVGQYPRFLRAHWKFLKTVVNKLFEFMHERHPGVQDMACDTFLKICNKCKRQFVTKQEGEGKKFIDELLCSLTETVYVLENHQVHAFYEAVGLMISAEWDGKTQEAYLVALMQMPNDTWRDILAKASQSPAVLKQYEVMKTAQNVLQTNTAVCSSLGTAFTPQMKLIFSDMLMIYKVYSELISSAIANGGPYEAKSHVVKSMRSVKRAALKLIETFVDKTEDADTFAKQMVPHMLDPILGDYNRNVPDARDAEVLSLFAAIIDKLQGLMAGEVPRIFEAVFECTLTMITKNFEDYPDHRLKFFSLLHSITNHCFPCLFNMSPEQVQLVMDSIVWAFRHTERNVADTGLQLLLDLLYRFGESDFATGFHQRYYFKLMQEVFAVLTDTFHKPGFKLHARILQHLFSIVLKGDVIRSPLWDVSMPGGAAAYPNNAAYARDAVTKLLCASFPNMHKQQVEACVTGMFEYTDFTQFKHHLRDFLAQTKQFASQDNAELFAEEVQAQKQADQQRLASVPGMIPQSDMQDI